LRWRWPACFCFAPLWESSYEMDYARKGEGGPGGLPLVDQEVCGPGSRVPFVPQTESRCWQRSWERRRMT
jgi:hypothetical protein